MSISLVIILTLAVVFYGFNSTKTLDEAKAFALDNQLAQIENALLLYENDHQGTWPASMASLAPVYLQAVPSPDKEAFVASAQSSVNENSWVKGDEKYIAVNGVSKAVCSKVNSKYSVPVSTDINVDSIPDNNIGLKGVYCFGDPATVTASGYSVVRVASSSEGHLIWGMFL